MKVGDFTLVLLQKSSNRACQKLNPLFSTPTAMETVPHPPRSAVLFSTVTPREGMQLLYFQRLEKRGFLVRRGTLTKMSRLWLLVTDTGADIALGPDSIVDKKSF